MPEIPVGIDGETVRLPTPVRCTVRRGALRVRLPRERPGIRPPRGRLEWAALWDLAVGRSPRAGADRSTPVETRPVADGVQLPAPRPGDLRETAPVRLPQPGATEQNGADGADGRGPL